MRHPPAIPPLLRSVPRRHAIGLALAAAAWPRPAAAAAQLSFATLYGAITAEGPQISAQARAALGGAVEIRGFMAPPLKAESDVFVLTRYPMASCPFCSSAADWPVDIVFVRLGRLAQPVEPSYAIAVTGTLEAGLKLDPATGFVSLVRIVDATWRPA